MEDEYNAYGVVNQLQTKLLEKTGQKVNISKQPNLKLIDICSYIVVAFPHSKCKGLVELNRTSSVPKSVFPYVVEKGQCFNLNLSLPCLVSQIKRLTVEGEFNSLFILMAESF